MSATRHLAEPGGLEVTLLVDGARPGERLLLQLQDGAEVLELLVEGDAAGRPRLGWFGERVSRRPGERPAGPGPPATRPPLPAPGWGAGRRSGSAAPEDLRGRGGGAGGSGGAACWGDWGARRDEGRGSRRLLGEGFIAEVQILKRIDVFRCAGHRLTGQTTCPAGVSPKAASPTRPETHMPTRHRLDNGLTLLHEHQGAAHVVAWQIWVNVGGADEGPDEAGLAHLHEHMLFKGTERRGPGEIARDIEAHGGEVNAWTSWDHTVYHTVMASQFAREGLDVLADAVRFPRFDPPELARECEVVVEEIKRAEDTPARRASRDLFRRELPGAPLPAAGARDAGERARHHPRAHPRLLPAALHARGDDAHRGGRRSAGVGAHLGRGAPRRRLEAPARAGPPPAAGAPADRPARAPRPGRGEGGLAQRLVRHPRRRTTRTCPALDVLAMLAGQGETSRLFRQVKRAGRLVNEISAYAYTPGGPRALRRRDDAPGEKVRPALTESLRTLAQLVAAPPTEEELGTIKALVESEAVYARETVQGLARKLGHYETSARRIRGRGAVPRPRRRAHAGRGPARWHAATSTSTPRW